jgi:hypothetical protein
VAVAAILVVPALVRSATVIELWFREVPLVTSEALLSGLTLGTSRE